MKTKLFAPPVYTYAGLYLFLFIFFLLTVLSGDDLGKVALIQRARLLDQNVIDLSLGFYESLNGRILGNALHYLTVGAPIVNALFRAAVSLGLLWAIARLARVKNLSFLPLILLATLMPTVPIMKQALIWSAGYYNYVVPTMLVLMLILVLRDFNGWRANLFLAFGAAAASLFAENITLALAFGSICVLVGATALRRLNWQVWSLVLGSLVGATLMFASPAYAKIASGEDIYRPMPGEGNGAFASMIHRLVENFPLLSQNLVTDLAPIYLVAALCVVWASKFWRGVKGDWIAPGILVGTALAMNMVRLVGLNRLGGQLKEVASGALILVFLIYVSAIVMCLIRSRDTTKMKLMVWPLGGVVLAAPFLLVVPFGPRNFYFTALCFVILVLSLVADEINGLESLGKVGPMAVLAGVILALGVLSVMGVNKVVEMRNTVDAENQYESGASVIQLRAYPFPSLVHDGVNSRKYAGAISDIVCKDGTCQPGRSIEVVFE